MSVAAEIWFFISPPNKEIVVLGRPSAISLAQLLLGSQGQSWKVRKNKSHTLLPISEFLELVGATAQSSSLTSHFADLDNQSELPTPGAGETGVSFELAEEDEGPAFSAPVQLPKMPHTAPVRTEKTRTKAVKTEKTNISAQGPRKTGKETRRHERHNLRLRVVILAGTRSFRSFSKNISKGGLFLEHVVPVELVGEKCRVIISSPDLKENIEFQARLAGDSQNPRALSFEGGNSEFMGRLEAWLSSSPKAA